MGSGHRTLEPASTGSSRRDGQRSAGTKSEATFSRVFRVWRCAVIGCFAVVLGRLAAGGKGVVTAVLLRLVIAVGTVRPAQRQPRSASALRAAVMAPRASLASCHDAWVAQWPVCVCCGHPDWPCYVLVRLAVSLHPAEDGTLALLGDWIGSGLP